MELQFRSFWKRIDWMLVAILFVFFCVSLLAISSAQTTSYTGQNYIPKQIIYYGIAAFIIVFVMYLDMEQYKKITWYLYGFGIMLLVVLIFMPEGKGQIGQIVNGAKSWYHTPIGNIQPSEFMKTFYILACAKIIAIHNEHHVLRTIKTDCLLLVKILALLSIPFFLVMEQPDLGSSLVFLAITVALIVVSGISWVVIASILAIGTSIGGLAIWMALYMQDFLFETFGIENYKMARIYSWLDPYSYSSNEGFNSFLQ